MGKFRCSDSTQGDSIHHDPYLDGDDVCSVRFYWRLVDDEHAGPVSRHFMPAPPDRTRVSVRPAPLKAQRTTLDHSSWNGQRRTSYGAAASHAFLGAQRHICRSVSRDFETAALGEEVLRARRSPRPCSAPVRGERFRWRQTCQPRMSFPGFEWLRPVLRTLGI